MSNAGWQQEKASTRTIAESNAVTAWGQTVSRTAHVNYMPTSNQVHVGLLLTNQLTGADSSHVCMAGILR